MNFKRFHESKNLFDKSTITTGAFVILTGTRESAAYYCSDFIPITATSYYFQNVVGKAMQNAIVVYDANKQGLRYITIPGSGAVSGAVTFEEGDAYIRINCFNTTDVNTVMVNLGSTPQPYEPYSSEVWHDIPHYIHNTSTDTLTTLPAVLYPNAVTATVGLKGNMSQSSQPSPTTPIQPSECGERTGNLFDISQVVTNTQVINQGSSLKIMIPSTITGVNAAMPNTLQDYCPTLNVGDEVTLSFKTTGSSRFIYLSGENIAWGSGQSKTITATMLSSVVTWYASGRDTEAVISNIMLNSGSTPLPYEPYGYKIPISSANATTPVYLGEVETTRRVKKLMLTGEESWNTHRSTYYIAVSDYYRMYDIGSHLSVCSHYPNIQVLTLPEMHYGLGGLIDGKTDTAWNGNIVFNPSSMISSLTDWKAYLAQQYAAGTPVCVWYVLATPTTGIVNEPIRKIGDYADEVSGITIPTTAGADSFDVLTTLKPSEVTVNYKGWHPVADVHVYPDSSWLPTSWEEFRKAVRSGKAQSLYPVGTKLYENWGDTTSNAWIVVDYPTGEDYLDSDLAQQGYTNRVMLMEEKLNYLIQFDAIEAWLYAETAIPAGTYRFTIPNYDASYGGNKTYIFTSTANVPVGGQLTLAWAYHQNPSAVQAYSSSTATSTLFNVSIAEWDGTTPCTDLGTIKLSMSDADSTYGKLNHIQRARYGSSNYYQSGYRQWLNTNASANWWTPTNVFDRPYGNRTDAGRLNVMNSNMKSVLATPTVNCITNNQFEYPSLDGTTFSLQTAYTVKDKLFPVTHSEINLSSSPNVNFVLDYCVGKGNADRIKYRKDNGNAYYWWLRTPYPTYAGYVRNVITSGALDNYFAYSTRGSAAACIIQ